MGSSGSVSGLKQGWLREPVAGQVIVFVHGFTGSAAGTWGQAGQSWPELVVSDVRFDDVGVFVCQYESTLRSGPYGFEEATRQVMTQLEIGPSTAPKLVDCDTIMFVGHSAGGIISRSILVQNLWQFRGKRVGLALVGSPSKGSPWADWGVALRDTASTVPVIGDALRSIGGKQLGQLTTRSMFLLALDAKFQLLIDNQFLTIVGREFIEHRGKVVGVPEIVSKDSAAVYYPAESVMIAESNHSSICRPGSLEAQIHQELVRLWSQVTAMISSKDEGVKQAELSLRNAADLRLFHELEAILRPTDAACWRNWIPGESYEDAWMKSMWRLQDRADEPDCFFHDARLQAAHARHVECNRAFTSAIAKENDSDIAGRGRVSKHGKGIASTTNPGKDLYDEAIDRVTNAQMSWIRAYDTYIETFKRCLIL